MCMRANNVTSFKIKILLNQCKNLFPWGRRTIWARWPDRPRPCQRGLSLPSCGEPSGLSRWTVYIRKIEFGQGRCVSETLYYGPSGVFSRTVSGPCVDHPSMIGGPSARITENDLALCYSSVSGSGPSGPSGRTVQALLFWQPWQVSNGRYSHYWYGGPSGPRARTVRVYTESVQVTHDGYICVEGL
jgi:hypothetical protein